jgi:dynamin 1-like protein
MNGINMGMDNMSLNRPYNTPGNSSTIGANADELYGGARISYIFHQVFSRSLNSVGAFDGLSEDEIRTTIGNANGTRPALFVPEISFDILVRRQIRRLEQPGVQCVDLVYDELQRIAHQSEPTELTRYPNLRDRMLSVVGSLLKRSVGPTQMWVSNLVRIELSYINTNHPDFIGGSRAVAKLMEKMAQEKEKAAIAASNSVSVHSNHPQHHNMNKEGTMMTPVKERANSPEVGATPLSSSSLEKYMAADDGYVSQQGAPPQHVVVDRSISGSGVDNSGGGIMNFIFRGNQGSSSAAGMGGINRSNSWNNNRNRGNSRPAGGPPAIVQLPQVPDTMRQTDAPPSDREKVETEIIKSLIDSYFSIVRKNYIDMVPKTIMYFLVNHVKDEMQNELVSELYRETEVGFLMKEAEDMAIRRRTCIEMRDLLEKALEIVNEVRDFNTFATK